MSRGLGDVYKRQAGSWLLTFIRGGESAHIIWVPAVAVLVTLVSVFLAIREIRSDDPFHVRGQSVTGRSLFARLSWLRDYPGDQYFIIPFSFIAKSLAVFEIHVVDGVVNAAGRVSVVLGHMIAWFDRFVVDGVVNGIVFLIHTAGNAVRGLQNGRIQSYYIVTAMGVFLLILWLVVT